jgi:large subunit ribosomal protein L4
MMQKKNNSQENAQMHVFSMGDLGIEEVQHAPLAHSCFAEYIRALRQNWRQGTVGCKDRSEVAFSNRKPWKQKGTGRARAGSRRSPLWRKGGVIFGPQPRVRTLRVMQQVKKAVMRSLLLEALAQGKIISLAYESQDKPNTAKAVQLLKQAGLNEKKVVLLTSLYDANVHASFANIPTVQLSLFDQLNAFVLSQSAYWVFLSKDIDAFRQMVQQWI